MKRRFVKDQVAVLLCCKDGERFLAEQLDSLSAQTYSHWKLWVSDDNSEDGTIDILNRYATILGERFSLQSGPGRGFIANFLSLVCDRKICASYYAFCDQDDIWEPEKLHRAITWLKSIPAHEPGLYCSRTRLINETGCEIGLSPLFAKPPGFTNALAQNIGGGNTMVFNDAARQLLCEAGMEVDVASHDWWVYLLVCGCGGRVFYDPWPSLRYRQHNTNLVGCNTGWAAKLLRLKLLWQGRYQGWNNLHLVALQKVQHLLSPRNRSILILWGQLRRQSMLPRLAGFIRSGIHRQTLSGNIGLLVAVLLGRI